jgi:integrase
MKLTVKNTESLKLPIGTPGKPGDHIEWDDDIPGFGIRSRSGGSRTWIFQYKLGDRQRRMKLGKYPAISAPAAREQAAKLHGKVTNGHDPAGDKAESKARSGDTFERCLKLYLERRRDDPKLRPVSYREIERHLDRNLKGLHGIRIDKIDRRAIALELANFGKGKPTQANRTRASLVKFLNWCAGEGFIDANPAMFTNKNPERPRERVLKDGELRTIWRALPDGDFGHIVKLLMLSGQRAREIGSLRWDEIDLERVIITLPPARTKNRRWHTIPISDPARAILEARPRSSRAFVFGSGQGGFSGWSKAKSQLDQKVKIAPWVVHDLRRAVSTGMNEIGIEPHVVEAVLNHISCSRGGVAGRYNKAEYEAQKTTALARWAEHLTAVVEGRKSNVTQLKRA